MFVIACLLFVITVIRLICLYFLNEYRLRVDCNNEEKSSEMALEKINRMDAQLMRYNTKITEEEKKEQMRKRNLFDGFRTMARNLFVLFGILTTYGISFEGVLSSIIRKAYSEPKSYFLIIGISVMLLLRYWHYSYLRFKYIYEDYLYYNNVLAEKT